MTENEIITLAKKDLAHRTGIPVERVLLQRIESIDFPDASLGCPEKGKSYAQVTTPGYRLILSDGTNHFEYHSDSHSRVVFCHREHETKWKER